MADILIVEDDDDLARIIEHRLHREGYDIERVRDGKAGLERLAQEPLPRLVTLDVMMPFMNGFDVLKAIRATPALQGLPVLMLTSMGREEDVVRGLRTGATEYLTKPFKPGELVARVKRLLAAKSEPSK
jgi:two-component system alkaline phosphatase synthesis response regulator PhoP/two-component system response regulator VicR